MTCETCGKRLSKKSARLINGKVVCSSCMWKTNRGQSSTPGASS